MCEPNTSARPYHSLLVLAAVTGAAIPAALLTMLANSLGKEGPDYRFLHFGVLCAASASGMGMYLLQLRIDPNVPKLSLVPAVVTSFIASGIAFVAALIWFVN